MILNFLLKEKAPTGLATRCLARTCTQRPAKRETEQLARGGIYFENEFFVHLTRCTALFNF